MPKIDAQTAGFITAWLGIVAMTICIIMGHDGTLVDTLVGINLAAMGAVGVKVVTKK